MARDFFWHVMWLPSKTNENPRKRFQGAVFSPKPKKPMGFWEVFCPRNPTWLAGKSPFLIGDTSTQMVGVFTYF